MPSGHGMLKAGEIRCIDVIIRVEVEDRASDAQFNGRTGHARCEFGVVAQIDVTIAIVISGQ